MEANACFVFMRSHSTQLTRVLAGCVVLWSVVPWSLLSPLSKILGWIADPVEPFGFETVQSDLPPLLFDSSRHRLGEQPGLFDEANGRLADMLQ